MEEKENMKVLTTWGRLAPGDKIALIALLIAFLSIALGAYNAYQADRVVHTNVKPILDILNIENSEGEKIVALINYGLGPAVITNVKYNKNDKTSTDIRDFVELPSDVGYRTFKFGSNCTYIKKDGEIILAEIKMKDLKEQKYSDRQIENFMNKWEENIDGINIEIAYTDILGEEQEPLTGKSSMNIKE